jgi:hypothetical protein
VSRFDDGEGEGMTWEMWENVVSRALGGRKGQEALAEVETALLALPDRKLIEGRLADGGAVCAVGAFVAHRRAEQEGIDLPAVIEAMGVGVKCWCGHGHAAHRDESCTATSRWGNGSCACSGYDPDPEDAWETAAAGRAAGMGYTVAWHLAYLNDEQFAGATPEERYEQMLAWVRRAQGKPEAAVA